MVHRSREACFADVGSTSTVADFHRGRFDSLGGRVDFRVGRFDPDTLAVGRFDQPPACLMIIKGLFHKSIVFYDTKKLVYFTIKSFPENDRKKCCTNKILNLEVS